MTAGEIVETPDAEATLAVNPHGEIARLRARVDELEAELVEISARSNAAIAHAQAQTYWLERWHLDLNELMRRPGAEEIRLTVRAIRTIVRRVRRLKRRLGS